MKILVVEDELEKKRLISQTVLEVNGVELNDLSYASDVHEAKKLLKLRKFDLLILDINIPGRPDESTRLGGGLDVLSFIRNNLQAIAPSYVIGMSAYEDGLNAAESAFSTPLWKLVRFSFTDLSWKAPLQQAISYLADRHRPPYTSDGTTFHIDLGIVVGLDEELKSLERLSAGWSKIDVPYDHARYIKGQFGEGDCRLDVVAVAAPKMGMPPAAVAATKLIQSFRPRYLAIPGICAGVRGKTDIGDILVADPCFDWGSGKWVIDPATKSLKFRPAPYPWRLDEALRRGIQRTADTPGLLNSIHASFNGARPAQRPEVIVEAMASGGSVLQASELMDDVKDQHKNLVGVEMESYAVFTAAEYMSDPRPQCFSMKSVCDFGDDTKSDQYHEYAAHTSTQFLYHFALNYLCAEKERIL